MPDARKSYPQTKTIQRSNSNWPKRMRTLRQAFRILKAERLIRTQSMAHWKGSLGETMTGEFGAVGEHDSNRSAILREAATYARQTERAAARLPYSPKCLPIAMALQWCARDAGLPTRLVVAIRNRSASLDFDPEALNLTDEDKYHAWVELDGIMLVGECERAEYMPVFGFQLPDTVMGQAFEQPG